MADKEIVQLPASSGVTDETLFPAYQPGAAALAQKVTAKQIREYVKNTSTENWTFTLEDGSTVIKAVYVG